MFVERCATAVVALNAAPRSWHSATTHLRRCARPRDYHQESASRPYTFWVFGSPVAWAVMLGMPNSLVALRALCESEPAALALVAVVVVSAVLGFTKAETERIWLPFVPLACVAAAAFIPPRRVRWLLPVLALQALAVELLFVTIW